MRLRISRSPSVSCSLPLPTPAAGESPVPWGILARFSAWLQMTFRICLFRWRSDKKQEWPSGGINSLRQAGSDPPKAGLGCVNRPPDPFTSFGVTFPLGSSTDRFDELHMKRTRGPQGALMHHIPFGSPTRGLLHLELEVRDLEWRNLGTVKSQPLWFCEVKSDLSPEGLQIIRIQSQLQAQDEDEPSWGNARCGTKAAHQKRHLLRDSEHTTFCKRQNCGDSRKIGGQQGSGRRKEWIGDAHGSFLGPWNYSVWYRNGE